MSLRRDRFYRDWYKPRRSRPDRFVVSGLILAAIGMLLAVAISQCQMRPTMSAKPLQNVHYLALEGDKVLRLSEDGSVVKNYWEF